MLNYVLMLALDLRRAPRTDLTNTSLSSLYFNADCVLGAHFPSTPFMIAYDTPYFMQLKRKNCIYQETK